MLYFSILELLKIIMSKTCVAAIGAMCFWCVASAAHFLIYGGIQNETDFQKSYVNVVCISDDFRNYRKYVFC